MRQAPQLVRVPDQFRPGRASAQAPTPTCCCCCCCCIATMVTSSVVLPMRVELAALRQPQEARPDPASVRAAKWLAGLAPWVALFATIAVGMTTRQVGGFLSPIAIVLLLLLMGAFAMVGRPAIGFLATVVFSVAFVLEVVVGVVGIFATAGIGYLVVGVAASWGAIAVNVRKLREARAGPGGALSGFAGPVWPPAPPMPPAAPPRVGPPVLPRPPSSEE